MNAHKGHTEEKLEAITGVKKKIINLFADMKSPDLRFKPINI